MDELIITEKENLTDIADAVREQTGETELMSINDIPSKIRTLSSGGIYAKIEDIPTKVSQLENDSKFISEEHVEDLYKKLASNTTLGFYCIEDVTVVVDGISQCIRQTQMLKLNYLKIVYLRLFQHQIILFYH